MYTPHTNIDVHKSHVESDESCDSLTVKVSFTFRVRNFLPGCLHASFHSIQDSPHSSSLGAEHGMGTKLGVCDTSFVEMYC